MKKRILFISQYFYPESFRGNDIAFHWAEQGHDVHVICGIPNYPDGRFYDGYGLGKRRTEVVNGVEVTRLAIFPRGKGRLSLILNYFSYFIVAWVYVLFHAFRHKYDLVFCQQLSPVMISSPAVLYKKLCHVPLYTWVLDLWPESLSAAGGIGNKYILGFFRYFVKKEYKYSDKLLISSESFKQSILEYGDYGEKIVYYPQWSDSVDRRYKGVSLTEILRQRGLDEAVVFDKKGFYVMFAGAIGEAHGMECNMQAALLTKEYKNIKWVIVGDGRVLPWVKEFVAEHGLEETVFPLGRFPSDTMPLFFEKADVMLVSLNDSPLFNLYTPAKISSYMASAKPIVACLNGECTELVKRAGCGWRVASGDAEGLANLVVELSKMEASILKECGANGRKYYEQYFEKHTCLEKLDKIISSK